MHSIERKVSLFLKDKVVTVAYGWRGLLETCAIWFWENARRRFDSAYVHDESSSMMAWEGIFLEIKIHYAWQPYIPPTD